MGVSVIGLGRPLLRRPRRGLDSGLRHGLRPREDRLLVGPGFLSPASASPLVKALNALASQAWFYQQLRYVGSGRAPNLKLGAFGAYLAERRDDARINRTMRDP